MFVRYPLFSPCRVIRRVAGKMGGVMVSFMCVVVLPYTRIRFVNRLVNRRADLLTGTTVTRNYRARATCDDSSCSRGRCRCSFRVLDLFGSVVIPRGILRHVLVQRGVRSICYYKGVVFVRCTQVGCLRCLDPVVVGTVGFCRSTTLL